MVFQAVKYIDPQIRLAERAIKIFYVWKLKFPIMLIINMFKDYTGTNEWTLEWKFLIY